MAKQKPVRVVEKKLGRERALGQAIKGGGYRGRDLIEVDPRQSPREYMDTIIHEGLHVINPATPERVVSSTASKLASILWMQGFRRVHL